MIASCLRQGMAAGLLAGLLAGLFAFAFGEQSVDGAIRIEEASAAEQRAKAFADNPQEEELVGRSTQKVGLFFATGLFGVTLGGVFGIAFAIAWPRVASGVAACRWHAPLFSVLS